MTSYRFVVLGARGSIPVSGDAFARYGGNTTCQAIIADNEIVAFLDAGTGLPSFGSIGVPLAPVVDVFVTHYHWDHIQGLSMFDELWRGSCGVHVWGPDDPRAAFDRAIAPPLFPVSIAEAAAISFKSLDEPVAVGELIVTPFPVHHPQGACGFRIDGPNQSIGIVTDHESGKGLDDSIAEVISGVDVLFHDAQYLPSETDIHDGWGHSTYEDAVAMAKRVGAGKLILTSHDPRRTDDKVDEIVDIVRGMFDPADASRPGLEITL
jgi:ribonuclease BN (tRNA processing enzyme)